jgi:hypothetical protein
MKRKTGKRDVVSGLRQRGGATQVLKKKFCQGHADYYKETGWLFEGDDVEIVSVQECQAKIHPAPPTTKKEKATK